MSEHWSEDAILALKEGNLIRFRDLTGGAYTINGIVVHGNHLGRKLGFPTANIAPDPETPFLAAQGVYAILAETGGQTYKGISNAGCRPSVDGRQLTVEVHLFNYSGDLYGKNIRVTFLHRIREERKFDTLEELQHQIRQDIHLSIRLLA